MNALTSSAKLHDCRDAFVSTLERLSADNSRMTRSARRSWAGSSPNGRNGW
jgi:transketolase